VAERLLRLRPEWDEGRLSQERARLVCTAALAGHARRLGLGERLSVGGSARPAEVRNSEKALCDGVEALVGAGFAAGGLPVAEWVAGAMGLLPWVARGTGALP
jgi:ribonuclease-3